MIISHSHKFIFVHLYKVAGSSIRKALKGYESIPFRFKRGMVYLLTRYVPKTRMHFNKSIYFNNHCRATAIKEQLPEKVFNDYFKFAFVRNPWDWQVSLYYFMLRDKEHHQHDLMKSIKDFDSYLKWRVEKDNKHLQKEFLTDRDGKLMVDFVGRFENLREDFRHVCKTIGVECSLPHVNRSHHKDYRTFYNDKTIQLVYEHFKEDIELFGYTFEA